MLTLALSLGVGLASIAVMNWKNTPATNAASNAVTAIGNGGQIFCSNKVTGVLSISSSGICEPATQLPFIFQNTGQVGTNGYIPKSICGTDGKSKCVVGAVGPAGGTIFYVDIYNEFPNFTYLEATKSGWDGKVPAMDPAVTWCNDTTHIIQTTSTPWSSRIIGSGKSNTAAMKLSCTAGAAIAVNEYNTSKRSKFSDWYVPSLGELILLSTNLQGKAGLGADDYWSSSEYSDIGGWAQSVGHGYQGNANKGTLFHLRPIRSF